MGTLEGFENMLNKLSASIVYQCKIDLNLTLFTLSSENF